MKDDEIIITTHPEKKQPNTEAYKWLNELKESLPMPKLTDEHRKVLYNKLKESRFSQDKRSRRKRAFVPIKQRDD